MRLLRGGRLLAGLAVLLPLGFAQAAGTPANTAISNTATVDYLDAGAVPRTLTSAPAVVTVGEVLAVAVAVNDAGNVPVTTPHANAPLSFTVTNLGNGVEAFNLSFDNALAGDQFNPTNSRIFADDGNGLFDAADAQVTAVTLDPDAARVVYVVSDVPAGLANSDLGGVRLVATAATGSGAPGTTFAGAGTGGADAVAGAQGADDQQQNAYAVSLVTTTLTKTQAVDDGAGGSTPVAGATVTYAVTLTVAGAGSIAGAQIVDAIPAGTTYVPGSLRLNAAGLTDGADADAGRYTGSGIEVNLGNLTAPATRTVTFRTTLN